MRGDNRRYCYPIDLDRVADDVEKRRIDIAPTRLQWTLLAQCLATYAGEEGRNAFHRMAAIWPDYSRHDSELCYNAAIRREGKQVSIGWLVAQLRPYRIDINSPRYRASNKAIVYKRHKKMKKNETKNVNIPLEVFISTLRNNRSIIGRSNLTDMLLNFFPQEKVLRVLDSYLIGYRSFKSGMLQDSIIFWQVDDNNVIFNCKEIQYKLDGHRDKNFPPLVKYPGNPQCLFGLHLLSDSDKPIAIVESEKSAIVMAIAMTDFVWMACGSLSNFTESMLAPLRKRKIVGFPDVDMKRDAKSGVSISMAQWQKTAAQLRAKGWDVTIDGTLEKSVNTSQRMDKIDVADMVLEKAKADFIKRLRR